MILEFCKVNANVSAPSMVSLPLASMVAVPVPSNFITISSPSHEATAGRFTVTAVVELLR